MNDNHDEEHGSFLSKLFSKKGEPSNQNELEQVIHEASENDVIDEDTEDMIQGIFDINRLRVSDVMGFSAFTSSDGEATLAVSPFTASFTIAFSTIGIGSWLLLI